MSTGHNQISPDTQVTLLLCGHLEKEKTNRLDPLRPQEYTRLTKWLISQEMRPADLLEVSGVERLRQADYDASELTRITKLLDRGGLLAFQTESWNNQGIWILGRSDEGYPYRWKDRLKHQSPAIVYGVGNRHLLNQGGLAIVGSRNVDDAGLYFTKNIAERCVDCGVTVISGGARGVDQASMVHALEMAGNVVGILADSLAKASVSAQYRRDLRAERLVLISPYAPHAGFNVGNAMGRNRLIYALADWALVIDSAANKGGTWAGATENLKHAWVPLFVRMEKGVSGGNGKLVNQGGIRLESNILGVGHSLVDILTRLISEQESHSSSNKRGLFDEISSTEKNEIVLKNNDTSFEFSTKRESDVFWQELILPLIMRLATQMEVLDKNALAKALDIRVVQANDWLERATDEGKLQKRTRPVCYELPRHGQLSLLSDQNTTGLLL